jgi:hypothetical protein
MAHIRWFFQKKSAQKFSATVSTRQGIIINLTACVQAFQFWKETLRPLLLHFLVLKSRFRNLSCIFGASLFHGPHFLLRGWSSVCFILILFYYNIINKLRLIFKCIDYLRTVACIINLWRLLMTTLGSSLSLKLHLLMMLELLFTIVTCLKYRPQGC